MGAMTETLVPFFRGQGRGTDTLRPFRLQPDFVGTAEGSVLISMGETRVLCNASIESGVAGLDAWAGPGNGSQRNTGCCRGRR